MSQHICKECKKSFCNKFSLKRHTTNSSTCDGNKTKCVCGNYFFKNNYESHKTICKDAIISSLKEENLSLKLDISKLQEWKHDYFIEQNKKLEEKLDKSRNNITINNSKVNNTSNNNNIMINENFNLSIIPDMSKSNIEKICHDKLTKNIVAGGDDRIAEFIVDNVFRSDDGRLIVRCTDPTRKTMTYTLDGKTQFYDIEGNKIKQSIQRGTHLYIVKYANTLVDYTNIFSTDEIFTYDKILKRICILTYGKGCGKLDKLERKNNGKVEYIRDILRNKGLLREDEKHEEKNEKKENLYNIENTIEEITEGETTEDIKEIIHSEEEEETIDGIEEGEISKNNHQAVLIEFVDEENPIILDNSKTKNIFDIDIPEEFLHETDDIDVSYKIKAKMAKENFEKNWDSYRLTQEEREKYIREMENED